MTVLTPEDIAAMKAPQARHCVSCLHFARDINTAPCRECLHTDPPGRARPLWALNLQMAVLAKDVAGFKNVVLDTKRPEEAPPREQLTLWGPA